MCYSPDMAKKPAKKKPASEDEVEVIQKTAEEQAAEWETYRQGMAAQIWSHDETGHDLTVEQGLFCRSYIIDRNPVAALRRLNYAGEPDKLKRIANRFLAVPEVQACIETLASRMMQKLEITAERVQKKIADIAFFDPRGVVMFDNLGLAILPSKFWTEEQIAALQSVKQGPNGIEIKFYDRLRAAEMLSKQLGMQPDEGVEAAAAASKVAAETVLDKVWEIWERTRPDRLAHDEQHNKLGDKAIN